MPSFFVGVDEFGKNIVLDVEPHDVRAYDLEKRIRVFAGWEILGNENLTLSMKERNYHKIASYAIRVKRLDMLRGLTGLWLGYLMEATI